MKFREKVVIVFNMEIISRPYMNSKTGSLKIDVYELAKGMFVEDIVDNDGNLLMTANEMIKSNDQIKKIINRGVSTVFINMEKGDVPHHLIPVDEDKIKEEEEHVYTIDDYQKVMDPIHEKVDQYYKELEKAEKVHTRTIKSAQDIINSLKKGEDFYEYEVREVVQGIVGSLSRDPDAIVSTTQLETNSNYLVRHSVNVCILTASTVKAMGYSENMVIEAGIGGLLHDIGMLNVPQSILEKRGKLSDSEFNIIKQHPVLGLDKVNDIKGISDNTKKIILQHHERFDGKGYPFGIKGSRIYEVAMVTAVADVYDALTSNRPYKKAVTPQKALAVLYKGIEREFSASIVQLFTKNMGIFPVGSFVKLQCGIMGVVVHVDAKNILAPRILKLFEEDGEKVKEPEYMDLYKLQMEVDENAYRIDTSLEPDRFGIDPSKFITFKV